jgi:ribosomal protein S18 acetylase RimI-like enzyme
LTPSVFLIKKEKKMPLKIKRLTKKDLKIARNMFIQFINEGDTVSDDKHLLNLLGKKSFYGVVALEGDTIVGRLVAYEFEMYHDNTREVYLYEIDVEEAYQNQGIGSKLIEFTKKICEKRGVDYMFVGTDADNLPAQKLYVKTGGLLEGHLPHYEYVFDKKPTR